MPSVPRIGRFDDGGEWQDLEAALSVAYAALTDAQALHERLVPEPPRGGGLDFGQALAICVTILDAYLDPLGNES